MKLKEITYQHRRDIKMILECENCGETVEEKGYDDRFFWDEVLPDVKCPSCKKSRNDLGIKGDFVETKYGEWETV